MDPKKIKQKIHAAMCLLLREGGERDEQRTIDEWRFKAVEPPGEARPDSDIITDLYFRIKELYECEGGL